MKKLTLLVLLLSCLSWGQGYNAFQQTTFTTVTTASPLIERSTILFHQLSWTVSGTVSTCTVAIDSSPDGTTWTPGGIIAGQTCTTNGSSAVTSASAVWIRVNMTAISGAGATAVVVYKGYVTNPSGGGGGTPGGANGQIQYNNSGAFGGTTGLTTDAVGNVTLAQGTITTSKPIMSHTGTWNAGGVVFTNWLSNITCTAAAANSKALAYQIGGVDALNLIFTGANCATATQLNVGKASAGGILGLLGSTSGTATITAPAVAGTTTNPLVISNTTTIGNGTATNPSVAGATNTNNGINFTAANVMDIVIGGSNSLRFASGGNRFAANQPIGFSSNNDATAAGADIAISRIAAGVMAVGTGAAASKAGFLTSGNTVFVTGDFTTSGVGTALENITGLTWTFPATALNFSFHCHLAYHQNVATAAVAFGLQDTTNAPTNLMAVGHSQTNTTAFTEGVLAALTTTTATNVVSATPSAITTNWVAEINGTVEHGATAHTLNLMVSTATAADTVTVLRGSYCALTP